MIREGSRDGQMTDFWTTVSEPNRITGADCDANLGHDALEYHDTLEHHSEFIAAWQVIQNLDGGLAGSVMQINNNDGVNYDYG